MEGLGSRLGRASSRHGPVASSPVFTGPVRKWKRQWVVSSCNSNKKSSARSNNHQDGGPTANPPLLLPRWTPLSSDSVNVPRRKFRYTPVVALEQKKNEAIKGADLEEKASKVDQFTVSENSNRDNVFGKLKTENVILKEIQEVSKDMLPSTEKHTELDLFVKSHNEDSRISGQNDETGTA